MSTASLTPIQQVRVTRACEFLAAPASDEPAFDLGQASQHLRFLLEVIDDLTGGTS